MDKDAAVTGAPRRGHRLALRIVQRFGGGFLFDASLDIEIAAGSILVMFGPSGAGKTTMLRQIAGLERATSGRVEYDGSVWLDTSAGIWQEPQRRRVGEVFQEPTLFPHKTDADNIRYAVDAAAPWERSDEDSRSTRPRSVSVEVIRTLVAVDDLANRYPGALSGGEARRVALARALAAKPRLLLLDEPFAALDAPTRTRLRRDLRALLQSTGIPAILVTHDRAEAIAMGDQVAVIVGGRVRQTGAVEHVFGHPVDAEVAASVGVESVLPARVVAVANGLVEVVVGSVMLHAAERDAVPPGAQVFACIRAEDVTLEMRRAGEASARNHLAAQVVDITAEGPIDRVALDCGFALDALITRRSREELRLEVGMRVTAAVKATSVHLVPRE
jgi:molybdate transport system ATP-binding protein